MAKAASSLYAFDRQTGAKAWSKTVIYDKDDPTHQTNPYCGSTPAADGKRVVVWHGSAGLHCYDFAGQPLWQPIWASSNTCGATARHR